MPRPREAAPDAGIRGLWAEYMVRCTGIPTGDRTSSAADTALPVARSLAVAAPARGEREAVAACPPPPSAAPSGRPTRGSPPGAPAQSAACLPPPRGRGRSARAVPAPPPGARGGRHGAHGSGAIGAAPSLSLLPRRVRQAGQAGRGAARVRGGGPLPSPLAGSLPPSLPPSLEAPAGNGSGPARPAVSTAAPPFRALGRRLGTRSTSGPRRIDRLACLRPCAPSEPRAEPPLPPRPATTTRSPPPAALPPPLPRFPRGLPRKPGPPRLSLLAAAAARGSGPAAPAPIGRPGGTSVICK